MNRRDVLALRLEAAGDRGLTEGAMRRIGGKNWRQRLGELRAEGYVIAEVKSRFRRHGEAYAWRFILRATPAEPTAHDDAERPLFDPPALSALTGDVRS